MQIREVVAKSIAQYAEDVQFRGSGRFQNKTTRDEVAKALNRLGISVHLGSIACQNLHPEYVTDYVGTLETGFWNSQYMTYWPKLYKVTIVR